MRISEAVFIRVLAALHPEQQQPSPEGGAPPTGNGRAWNRRASRRTVNRPVWYLRQGTPDAQPQAATLLDLSKAGVGILLGGVAAPGERLVVYLPFAPDTDDSLDAPAQQGGVLALPCTVRTCRVRADGQFRVGAEFIDPATADADGPAVVLTAEGLVERGGAADPEERGRREERHAADGRATMYLYRGGRQAPLEHVAVRDVSDHGVAIFRGEPLQVGEEFVIRVPRAEDKPITRLCRVVNAAPFDGRYRIGAEFIPFRGRGFLSRLRAWIA